MIPQPSDHPPKSPDKPPPSDLISTKTPTKPPNPRRINTRHRRSKKLPEKYEVLLRFYDALDASLKLLRLRKSVPVFSKVRVMVENMSDRRFTHQHLAQLKFLLPEEFGIRKVLFPDEETRCMKHDLHLALNVNRMNKSNKRKRGSRYSCLRDYFVSRLLEFLRAHPEGAEIPEEELPEPFNLKKQDLALHNIKLASSYSSMQKSSSMAFEPVATQASHFSVSFKKHFSKGGSENDTRNSLHSPASVSMINEIELESIIQLPQTVPKHLEVKNEQKPMVDGSTQVAIIKETPIKSLGTLVMPGTPALQTPKRHNQSPDDNLISSACEVVSRPSCARALLFEAPTRSVHIELQEDGAECSDGLDILPENLLQSLKEKERKTEVRTKRKQMIASLPKMFDRIYLLFQNPKFSAIRKEALIRDLTECHLDITDESEVEEQLNLLQEIIPGWILPRLSPSGNTLYSINKALNSYSLRLRLGEAM